MALQGQNSNQKRNPQNPNEPRVEPVVRRRGGGGFAWMWVWVVIIIAAFWFAGWGWGGYGGWWWGGRRPGIVGRTGAGPYNNGYHGATNGAANSANATPNNTPNNTSYNGANPKVANPAYNGTIAGSGVKILDSTDKRPYVGQHFQIQNVPVQAKVNNDVVWVGTSGASRMLVVLEKPSTNNANHAETANDSQATWVDVKGTVEKAPNEGHAKQQWGLSERGSQQLEQQGAYVLAAEIQPAKR